MTQHQVEALVSERQALRIGWLSLHLQAEPRGVSLQRLEHARGDVAARGRPDQAGAKQVQAEVASSRADLERPRVVARLMTERLAYLGADLAEPQLAKVDPPLGVVVVGRHVVVAGVRIADLLGAQNRWHGADHILARGGRASNYQHDYLDHRCILTTTSSPEPAPSVYQQRDQPDGVPPLALTGERTLPDVPEENYWYRRHLVVYEWIAQRLQGLRAIDMACGEGYGSAVLARSAASVVGVDANPEAHEHARLRYVRPNLRFERALVDSFAEQADAVVFLQTIEHLEDPGAVLDHFRSLVGSAGAVFVSTPNVLTLAPKGAPRSDNPWHVHEYRRHEYEQLCREHFSNVELYGLFHARKLRAHELALRLGWDRVHARLGVTGRFYDWFTPAIA